MGEPINRNLEGIVCFAIAAKSATTSGSYGELVSSIESRLRTARAMILSGLLSFTSMENTALTAWVQRWERADSMCTFWRQFGASLGEYRQATEGQAPVWCTVVSCACDARAAGAPACAICSAGSDDELLQALVSEVELGGASGMPSVSDCDTSEYEENPAPRAPGGRRWSLQLVRPADALEAARGRPRPPASAAARPAHPTHVSSQVTASDHTPPVSLSSLVISAEIPASAIWEGRGSGGDTAGPSGAGPPGEGGHRIEGRSSGDFKRGSVVSKVTPAMIASSGFFQSEGPRGPPGGPPAAPPAAPPKGGRSSLESKLGAQRGSVEYGTVALTSDDPVASRGSAPFIQRTTSRRPRGPVI